MALVAAVLNLVNEVFGPEDKVALPRDAGMRAGAHVPDLGVPDDAVRWRATIFFVWMAAFIALVFLIGFIPAIALFVFAYMRFGFGEPWATALGFSAATTLFCYVVFHWALAVASRQPFSRIARGDAADLTTAPSSRLCAPRRRASDRFP